MQLENIENFINNTNSTCHHTHLVGKLLPPVLIIDAILGFLGNIVALWIFCFKLKNWNPNNLFLFNLVIADLLVLVSLPLKIDALIRGTWVFGDGLCRINRFLMFSNRTASIVLMTVVAVYRYFKVVHPHHRFSHITRRQAAYVSMFVWVLAVTPWIVTLDHSHIHHNNNRTKCLLLPGLNTLRYTLSIVGLLLEFIIPLAMVLFCHIRMWRFLKKRKLGKKVRKAIRVFTIIIVVFIVCFLPTTVSALATWVTQKQKLSCTTVYTLNDLIVVSLGLNFLNSALDPIIYIFSSSTFRKVLCTSLPCASQCCVQCAGNLENMESSTESEMKTPNADGGKAAM